MANLGMAKNDIHNVEKLVLQVVGLHEHQLRSQGIFLDEKKLTDLIVSYETWQSSAFSMMLQPTAVTSPQRARLLAKLSLRVSLLYKGRIESEMTRVADNLRKLLSEEDKQLIDQLARLRSRYASLFLTPSASEGEGQRQLAASTEQRIASLEERIVQRTAALREKDALPSPATILDRVAERLPQATALVEFATYRPDLRRDGTASTSRAGMRYVGFLLHRDKSVMAVDLGDAESIDELAQKLHDKLSDKQEDFEETAEALYRKLILPFEQGIAGSNIRNLVIAPEGRMFLVPFEVLLHDKKFLSDRFCVSYVNSGRDLLRIPRPPRQTGDVVVFADPDFTTQDARLATNGSVGPTSRGARGLKLSYLPPLPGARKEAAAIAELIPHARLYEGRSATEERLFALRTPSILHIATHGLFFDASPQTVAEGSRSHFSIEDSVLVPSHPLLLSAIALAGAAAPWEKKEAQQDASDGIMTALEVSNLNLLGTQMVVLSACNSGRGLVRRGQGVYGLRRAFLIAGAETLVTSLWKVDDEVTQLFMTEFYQHLRKGEGRAEALRHAQQAVRQNQAHPYYWASFILIGQTRPLMGIPFR